jgi:hypothetical protein
MVCCGHLKINRGVIVRFSNVRDELYFVSAVIPNPTSFLFYVHCGAFLH